MLLNTKRFYGLHGASTGWLLGDFLSSNPQIIVVVKDQKSQEELSQDITFFTGVEPVTLSGWESMPFEEVSPETSVSAQRIASLLKISSQRSLIAVVTADALLQRVFPRSLFESLCFTVSTGEKLDKTELITRLDDGGFLQVPLVESLGEFAVRGNVIDLSPSTVEKPVRLEFEETVLKECRFFDPETQRSEEAITTFSIIPVRELFNLRSNGPFSKLQHDALSHLKCRGKELETPPQEIARFLTSVKSGIHLPGSELMQYITLPHTETFFEYAPHDALWVIHDEFGFHQMLDNLWAQVEAREERLSGEHRLIPSKQSHFLPPQTLLGTLNEKKSIRIDQLEVFHGDAAEEARNLRTISNTELKIRIAAQRTAGEANQALFSAISKLRKNGFSICFAVGSSIRAERLKEILLNIGIDAPLGFLTGREWIQHPARAPVIIIQGTISSGFQLPSEKVAFIAEHEIFSERSYRQSKKTKWSLKKILNSLAQLSEGDFVVHADYGIGVYRGLKHLEVEDAIGDFLHIEYADSKLFLPVQNIGRIQKFSAAEGQTPALDKLASTRWTKTKAKVRESVAELAGDLIRLYASRSVSKGWRFEPEGAEDDRFADTFPYNETPDQLKAIEDTLGDMAKDTVMDRLVCGDVGFGKTEVAIRAAFKCVQHKRQVAILVPTTILVEQHKKSFLNRFAGYDTSIEALSRFNDPKDTKRILEKLKSGELDIIVGTHRLLSNDVSFHDLGLLIIDEEHRFGVKQKEKLKAIKKSVDVLTLTATPIPRTLHMSLIGIRDISVMSTPPHDRKTIRTYIANHEEAVVRDAIVREIQRGGQVFFLHNRVQNIDLITASLKALVPEATFQFAHGQMSETMLENIMTDFIDRKFDVLVSTTIIESGIDIPNANTIIIDRADTFGLAQLYQLRGRVGRSTRQAYAYLLVPKTKSLSADARKRLKALQALDDLGLGFNLAMRDMEIRGAGNLLGREQSGNVLAVGFDLYSKILKEAVLNLKGEELDLSETIDPEVKIHAYGFLPEWYIPDVSERLIMYQRLSGIENDDDAKKMREEIDDRFGPLPPEVHALIELMRYRALLRKHGIVKAEVTNGALVLSPSKKASFNPEKLFALCKKHPEAFRLGKNLTISIKLEKSIIIDASDLYPITNELIERIS